MTEHSDIAPVPAAIGRRDFIRLAGSTAAGWLALSATPERMRIIGLLIGFPLSDQLASKQVPDGTKARFTGLIKDLYDRGWVEGVNIRFWKLLSSGSIAGIVRSRCTQLYRRRSNFGFYYPAFNFSDRVIVPKRS
jgi:hypothetical protein